MSDVSVTLTIDQLLDNVAAGVTPYLHKELHVSDGGKASMIKANTALTPKILNTLKHTHGGACLLTIGYEPLDLSVHETKIKHAAAICIELREIALKDAHKRIPEDFVNRSTLILAAQKAEEVLANPPSTPAETLMSTYAPRLKAQRDKLVFGTMLTHALADVLCMLYLDEIDIKKNSSQGREDPEEQRAACIAGVLLKDVAYAQEVALPSGMNLDAVHSQVSAHLLLGRDRTLTSNDLERVTEGLRGFDPVVGNAIRIVLEHENTDTKSKLAQRAIRGMYFSQWLLEQKDQDQGVLDREVLQKTGYFDPPEIPHFLNLAVHCMNPESNRVLKEYMQHNHLMRIPMFERFLKQKGAHLPLPSDDVVTTCFVSFFKTFPDYHPVGFEILRQLILYKNRMFLRGRSEDAVVAAIKKFAERLNSLLF